MLIGEFELKVDHKGRVAIPARFRDTFRSGLVLSRGFDRCLIVYTQMEWGKVAERLDSTPLTRINARRVARFTFSGAYDLDLDRQGRVNLPATLREYAAIGDQAVVIGAYSHLQIWARNLWDAEKQFMIEHAAEISEAVET